MQYILALAHSWIEPHHPMSTVAYYLKWIGYIISLVAIAGYIFIVSMPCQSCGIWDYVVFPLAMLVIPIASLIVAYRWPLIAGQVLIAVAILIGWDIINFSFWAAALYTLPFLVAGLSFIIAGILLLITERDTA